jgi:hypothetical protein
LFILENVIVRKINYKERGINNSFILNVKAIYASLLSFNKKIGRFILLSRGNYLGFRGQGSGVRKIVAKELIIALIKNANLSP